MMFKGDYEAAEACYARAAEIEEKTLGPKDPSLATTLNNWAAIMEIQVRVTVERVLTYRFHQISGLSPCSGVNNSWKRCKITRRCP